MKVCCDVFCLASFWAIFPMLANASIHGARSIEMGVLDMGGVCRDYMANISGLGACSLDSFADAMVYI